MPSRSNWKRFSQACYRARDLGLSIDFSRMAFGEGFFEKMEPASQKAFAAMAELEAGATANPDEDRMVGHYWLRNPAIAPPAIAKRIRRDLATIAAFGRAVRRGETTTPSGDRFTRVLLVGIGGSALGPQLVFDCLGRSRDGLAISFFDNTDPDGMARTLGEIGDELASTLVLVISKSGGTPETRNGMVVARSAYESQGLDFAPRAVAVTGPKSRLDQTAKGEGWLRRFPMEDWVGGRTSVTSVVGLLPAALQGVNTDAFLRGAAVIDRKTRSRKTLSNPAMLLSLMWFHATNGRGAKDMVVLPYKDRLALFSKYLQQLIMESLGKERDIYGNVVNQGITVYGNKGSTDQHAYVQQLRDGVNNFFATFIEVREGGGGSPVAVDGEGGTSADYLQGFLRGTRDALAENDRESITISLPRADAYYLGALVALFERAVGYYATLVNINAYNQPGVEAGKKAAGAFLALIGKARAALTARPKTAESVAKSVGAPDPENVFHALVHLSANDPQVEQIVGATPAEDTFRAVRGVARRRR